MDLKVAFLIESWGPPWNEGYKNLAKYIYEMLKTHLNIDVFEKNSSLAEQHNYDVVWIFNYPENLTTIFKLLNLKRINNVIVKEVAKKELDVGFRSKIKTLLLRRKLWDVIVTTTDLLKSELARFINDRRIFTLPPPIPVDYFKPLNKYRSKEVLGFEEDKIYIGYTGTINKYRRLDMVFKAIKNVALKNVVFVVALTNIQRKELGAVIREVRKAWVPLKFIITHDVRILYSSLDMLIYPVEREGSIEPPLTILEAMSCGIPVATLRNPITKKIIRDRLNGFLFNSPYELRTIIEEVLEDTLNKSKISVNARKRIIEMFDSKKLERRYLEFLKTLST